MSEPRVFPTVIEVPASFCDVYQTGSTTADPDPLGLEETAMLVIGGRTGSVNGNRSVKLLINWVQNAH